MNQNTDRSIEIMREQRIYDLNIMVSFDIKSLFTNVPTDKTIGIIKRNLRSTLAEKTELRCNIMNARNKYQ